MSNRVYTLEEIAAIIAPIAARYGVDKIYIFGSYARGEADESSLITVKSLKYNDDNDFKENLEKERVLIYEAA